MAEERLQGKPKTTKLFANQFAEDIKCLVRERAYKMEKANELNPSDVQIKEETFASWRYGPKCKELHVTVIIGFEEDGT